MYDNSLLYRFQVFTTAASIAVHSNNVAQGFRQSNLKFFIELFSNWCESSLSSDSIKVQNTQVMRFLENLVSEGYARKMSRKKTPLYKLTRIGLIHMLTKLTDATYYPNKEHFFFTVYFIKNYRNRLEELVKQEGAQFPSALRIELEHLLDTKRLVTQEKAFVIGEIRKLKERIADANNTSKLVNERLKNNAGFEEVLKEAEKLYPYQFNSQKPLSELIRQIPEEQRIWELTVGNLRRVEEIWQPALKQLETYSGLIDKVH